MPSNGGIVWSLTSGVQSIAGFLPLLGTEQCDSEEQVSSALSRGYLYAASAPMSIIGSLRVVSAALIACFSFRSVGEPRYLGLWELSHKEGTLGWVWLRGEWGVPHHRNSNWQIEQGTQHWQKPDNRGIPNPQVPCLESPDDGHNVLQTCSIYLFIWVPTIWTKGRQGFSQF